MEPHYLRFYNWLLVRIPVIPFPLGIFFWVVYQKSHFPLALGACKLSFGLFLLMPAWYLTFRPDLGIALLNALYAFLKPRSVHEPVRPLFKKTSWSALTSTERKILASIAIFLFGCGLVLIIQSYPILSQFSARDKE
jgi:hypothetical protein